MKRMNIYHRKDGRWEGRILRGKKNGKRKFQYVFARTKEQCEAKMVAIYQSKIPQCSCSKTMLELFSEWYHSILHRVKESTAANYVMKAEKHILPSFGTKSLSSIAADDVYAFISEKQKAGLSLRYIADVVILMKSLFKYAVRIYHITNPMDGIILPKKKTTEIQIFDDAEQKKLQQYVTEHQNLSTLGVALSFSTGIRIGELCALQWRDIDLEKRILTVKKTIQRIQCVNGFAKTKLILTEPKTESSKRTIPIPEYMAEILQKHIKSGSAFLVSGKEKPMEPRTLQYRFARILKNGKLPSVHFHALRHMFATNCIQLGFDVKTLSELLGHASVETTLNKYVHSSFAQKALLMDRLQLLV